MFSHVDGSMATAARAANGRARAGVPAVLATRCCRKDEPKRTGGNTGNTGNPLAGIRRARFRQRYQALRCIRRAAGLRRMGRRKWAETGGNSLQKYCSGSTPTGNRLPHYRKYRKFAGSVA